MFKNVFSFKGRIRRLEFGISYIFYLTYSILIKQIADHFSNSTASILILASLIPAIWFLWAQGAKRCHDRGNSGWYQIIPFYVLLIIFGDGEHGPNEYGNNPKGIEHYNEIDNIGRSTKDD